ncbi:MAG: DedA family protein [Candidatus Zixiibacteriota bacterium]|nr:MAG: DedA family protein [candidate division Zixibacteria bacterium]
MFEAILEPIGAWTINLISQLGYFGIIIAMGIESACIPLPSEIIMPFSGYLVFAGRFSLWGVSVAGAFGCVVGSVVAYFAGIWGGRPFILRYGRYVLVSPKHLATADRWFERYGDWAIFFSRLLPVIRTFISLPAGIARMNFVKFIIYTFLGSLPWCFALAYVGKILGENWMSIRGYFHKADIVIVVVIVAGLAYFLYRHFRPEKENKVTPVE